MPPELKDRIQAAADANNRSLNAEIVAALERAYPRADPVLEMIEKVTAGMTMEEKAQLHRQAEVFRRMVNQIHDRKAG
jgi:hypothetical protein